MSTCERANPVTTGLCSVSGAEHIKPQHQPHSGIQPSQFWPRRTLLERVLRLEHVEAYRPPCYYTNARRPVAYMKPPATLGRHRGSAYS